MHLARTICPQTQTRLRVYVTPDPPWARDYTRKRFSILFFYQYTDNIFNFARMNHQMRNLMLSLILQSTR